MSLTNPTDLVNEQRLSEFYQQIYPYLGGGSGRTQPKKTEIVKQTNVAIADGTAITLNLTKKYVNPYVFATNTLPKTGWGGLVTVNEDYGVTYDPTNNTLSFKTYTNYAQNYDIYWMVIELNDAGGGSSDQNNYSTTEQIVGTWIDGSPVYQKVVVFTPTSGDYTLDLSSLHIGHLIEVSGIVRETNGNDVSASYYTSSGDYVAPYFTISGGVFHARYGGRWNGGEWNVILKYTKSSS